MKTRTFAARRILLFAVFFIMVVTFLPGSMGESVCPEQTTDCGAMVLSVLNVGKADCILLQYGEINYMIDTGLGKETSWEQVSGVLNSLGITELTGVILTHGHPDHTGGLKKLLKSSVSVRHVYTSKYYLYTGKQTHPAEKAVKNTDLQVEYLSAGDTLPFGDGSLTVLAPLQENPEKENNNSLVLLASASGGTVLLTGDMEFPEEETLLASDTLSHVDILKIGNHGEDDATSAALISRLTPSYAVISTSSAEEPDTPSVRVLRLLESWNVQIFVTQNAENGIRFTVLNGAISVDSF